ncbi:MAG TPA: hypothetical protein VIV60_26950, partial [Polyangiaceae bacterium]
MPRQEVVALADRLTAAAEREQDGEALRSLGQASRLRERIWRLEGRTVDGLEATELLSEMAKRGDCKARIMGRALRAEVDVRPASAVQSLAADSVTEREPECVESIRQLLALYAAKEGDLKPKAPGAKNTTVLAADSTVSEPKSTDLVVPSLSGSVQGIGPRVSSVQRYGSKDAARIVVGLTQPATFRAGILHSDDAGTAARLYVDIDRASLDKPESYEVGGLVKRVRLARRAEGTRLVLDLE